MRKRDLVVLGFELADELELPVDELDAVVVDEPRQTVDVGLVVVLGELGLAALVRLEQNVVDEDKLLLGLHEIVALVSYVLEERVNVNGALVFHLFHHRVDDDVGACAADARATVDHDGPAELWVRARRLLDEREHRQNVDGHAVVGPVRKVVLIDETLRITPLKRGHRETNKEKISSTCSRIFREKKEKFQESFY